MQVQQNSTHIQSFGGINFIKEYLRTQSFSSVVQDHLGLRSVLAQYSYAELLQQLFFIVAIGGDTLDESHTLKEQFSDHPDLRIASPDTIEYAFQELRQTTEMVTAPSGVIHQINEHKKFNELMPALSRKMGLLKPHTGYMMDYDGHIVENTKADKAFTYKKTEGYYPVLCSINKLPVYMQNRNGNTPESYNQYAIIKKAIDNCNDNDITVTSFRADACCYQKDTIEYLESQNITYYIRAENCLRLMDALADEPEWQQVILNNKKVEVCSIEEKILGSKDKYRRIVAYRYKQAGQLSIDNINGYRYYAIVTSDKEQTALQCIETYNQRGCGGEHHFKELDYDFNWTKLPFDNMEINTIYMYAMLVGYLLFNAVKQTYAAKLSFVNTTMRIKNFIHHFVTLPAKWIRTGRQWILKIFTTKEYGLLCT
jgi:hypothetical protein